MPDWFVFLAFGSLVGGLAYFVQMMVALAVGTYTRIRDLINDRRPLPAAAYTPLVQDTPRPLRDRAL